jgi:peptidoglycan hydrolase-like protein with peptidoglycan-binding domain
MKSRTTSTLLLAAVMAGQLTACASLSDLGAGPGLKRTRSQAESGDPDQQLALGVHYLNGDLLARDAVAANRWLRAAAVKTKVASTLSTARAREAQRRIGKFRSRSDGGTRDQPTIRYVQLTLTELGYEVGPVDGIAGEQTRVAISDYRARSGIGGGSEVNAALLARLRREVTG